jgi:predicted nucleic acid-binding protein
MPRALLDATVIIAYADSDDEDHATGREIVRGIDHGDLPTGVVTNDAILEILNVGDAMQAAYMRREELEFIYTFDGDFDAVDGIVRLSTAENPFT